MSPLPPAGSLPGEAIRAALVVVAVLGIFAGAEGWKRRVSPPVEWTRKLVHVGVGALAAAFPWIFGSAWTVLVLGALFALVIRETRRRALLRSVHCVERRSEGDYYYLLAVALLFPLAQERPVFYLVSLLVLIVADSAAALLGSAYGRWTYSAEGDRRSVEGSAVFFLTAFLCVHLPLCFAGVEPLRSALIAAQLALLVTTLEAISVRGNDNLIVPLATYYLLVKLTPHPAEWIALQLAVQLLILGLLALAGTRWKLFGVSGVLAAHLFLYGALALNGPAWLLAPLLALGGFILLRILQPEMPGAAPLQVGAVFYATAAALLLYVLENAFRTLLPMPAWFDRRPFYAAFVGTLAAQLAISVFTRLRSAGIGVSGPAAAAFGLAVVVPASLWAAPGGPQASGFLSAAGICLGGLLAYQRLRPVATAAPSERRLQAACVAAAAALVLPLHLWWSGP